MQFVELTLPAHVNVSMEYNKFLSYSDKEECPEVNYWIPFTLSIHVYHIGLGLSLNPLRDEMHERNVSIVTIICKCNYI